MESGNSVCSLSYESTASGWERSSLHLSFFNALHIFEGGNLSCFFSWVSLEPVATLDDETIGGCCGMKTNGFSR